MGRFLEKSIQDLDLRIDGFLDWFGGLPHRPAIPKFRELAGSGQAVATRPSSTMSDGLKHAAPSLTGARGN